MSDPRQEIRHTIRGMILERFLQGASPSTLKDDASLERSHVVDSVKTMDLILFLEERFSIAVEPEDAVPENFDSVDALVGYVARKTGV
jgi:acyl carrier protein